MPKAEKQTRRHWELLRLVALQLPISTFTVLLICLPLLFSISSHAGLSFESLVNLSGNPKYIGAYLFINIAISSIWIPYFLFSAQKKEIDTQVGFEFRHQLITVICLGFLLLVALYSAFSFGISIDEPQKVLKDTVRVARFAAVSIVIHYYLDAIISIKTKDLHRRLELKISSGHENETQVANPSSRRQ